jgi:hypothetical protein
VSRRAGYDAGPKTYATHTADGRVLDPRYDREPKLRALSIAAAILGIIIGLAYDRPGYRLCRQGIDDPAAAAAVRGEAFDHPMVQLLRGAEHLGQEAAAWWGGFLSERDESGGKSRKLITPRPAIPGAREGSMRLWGPLATFLMYLLVFHVWFRPNAAYRADFPKLWSQSVLTRVFFGLVDAVFFGSLGSVTAYFFF